jgi:ADP-ribose pyrophosphatase YjhB (NUDIX family)
MTALELLSKAKRIQAIAQTGLTYCKDPFDLDRYGELMRISFELLEASTDAPLDRIAGVFSHEVGYPTPKMDVRASIVVDGRILLVKETADGKWSLPGGWADIDLSVREMAVKESREETGLEVLPGKLVAVLERNRHNPPPMHCGCIKIFVECAALEPEAALAIEKRFEPNFETSAIGFFAPDSLPPLSETRVTAAQIELCIRAHGDPNWKTCFD